MNNPWNKVIYRVWAPFYDYLFYSGPFLKVRKKFFENLDIKPKNKVHFVGVGTGADLQFIKDRDVSVTAIDLSSEMLDRAKNKYDSPNIHFIEMDISQKLLVYCQVGYRGYTATRVLLQNGFNTANLTGGFKSYEADLFELEVGGTQ